MKKLLSVLLAAVLVVSAVLLGGCSKDGDTDSKDSKKTTETSTTQAVTLPGETETWGKMTVFVPEGLNFEQGAYGDSSDESALTINDPNDWKHYYLISTDSIDSIKDNVNTSRMMNESYGVEDVEEFTAGNHTWNGITYAEEDSWKIYILYTDNGEDSVMATICNSEDFDLSSDEVMAVVSSIEIG